MQPYLHRDLQHACTPVLQMNRWALLWRRDIVWRILIGFADWFRIILLKSTLAQYRYKLKNILIEECIASVADDTSGRSRIGLKSLLIYRNQHWTQCQQCRERGNSIERQAKLSLEEAPWVTTIKLVIQIETYPFCS